MKKYLLTFLLASIGLLAQAQQKRPDRNTISGTLKDAKNGEELIGASVIVEELKTGVLTNAYGYYSLNLTPGKYHVAYTYVGYATIHKEVDITSGNVLINIELSEEKRSLKEVVISGDKPDAKNIEQNKMSVVKLDIKEVKKIPILLGEVDIIKAIQLLPGIQSAGDGNTLFIVRGGNVDHNLVQLDEAVVYNPSHVVGFFSVFNGDAIKDFEIYKGGIPANYGGRLASVLDVRMKDGNSKKFSVTGGIGILSSRLTIEGPIQKDKSSFMISGRRSYFDVFFPLSSSTKDVTAYFGDLNMKVNFTLGEKDKLFLSGYVGRDNLGTGSLFGLGWGNQTATVRWNHIFNSRLFSNTSLIFSRYNYNFDLNISRNLNFTRLNYITDYTVKQDFNYFANPKNNFKFGFIATHHTYSPGEITPINSESIILEDKLPKKRALDYGIYGSHSIKISSRLTGEYGMRMSIFQNIGEGRGLVYQNGTPTYMNNGFVTTSPIIDTVNYGSGKVYNTYVGFEPRLNLTYLLNSSSSIKGSYNRMYQYMHLIQTTAASVGQEFWTPSDNYIKPQIADQVAVGYFKNFMENTIETSVEGYYKWMDNTVELKDDADVQFNEAVESQVLSGKGRSYGLEFLVRKQRGKTTGWISYTLSKSERKVEGVNNNEWFNFRFDRRNYLTFVVSQEISERVGVSANFIYATGDTYTPAVGYIELQGQKVIEYGARNSARVPAYHRMDVSLTLGRKKIPGKVYKNESNWVFSIYNVYGNKNPYSISFRENPDTGKNEAVKTYLFTFVPSVTYNFKF
ncbi:MAG: TonB-dependent receptor [Bacteroidota bacterium]